ncbi:MAG: VIT domain-containing protein, partial [Rhodothermales bacterium]|nr:VIT domain-containing protein [Rhodothermales bacterium]
MKRMARGWIGMVLLMLAGPAAAQGLVIGPEGRPAPLVLAEHRVAADVEERVAVVEVRHRFVNTSAGTVEGTFLFPLPAEAQVSDFTMTVDGEVLAGEVLAAEEARRIYEDIVRRSLDPALLELAGHRTFRARVFPIPPGAERTITLRYDATLPQDGETVTFRYPLRGSLTHRGAAMPTPWPEPRPTPAPRPAPTHPAHDAPAPQTLLRVAIAA